MSQVEQAMIMTNLKELDEVIMTADRIRAAPIPPVYSSHAGRLLLFYLFFLPVALLGMQLNGLVTAFVTTTAAFAVLGLDEVSQLSKNSMMDVADAFCCQRPPLLPTQQQQQGEAAASEPLLPHLAPPSYWQNGTGKSKEMLFVTAQS